MVMVKELHDVKQQEEGLTELSAGRVAQSLVAVGNAHTQQLQPLTRRLHSTSTRRNLAQLPVQQLQHFRVILWRKGRMRGFHLSTRQIGLSLCPLLLSNTRTHLGQVIELDGILIETFLLCLLCHKADDL